MTTSPCSPTEEAAPLKGAQVRVRLAPGARAVLTAAADVASHQPTAERAAIAANYICRVDGDLAPAVLAAWHQAEGWAGLDGAFIYELGHRCTPGEVAAALRRAAGEDGPEDEFSGMSRADLLGHVRKWKANATEWQERHDALQPSSDAMVAGAQAPLERAKGLLNAQRKTVPMDALREALIGGET